MISLEARQIFNGGIKPPISWYYTGQQNVNDGDLEIFGLNGGAGSALANNEDAIILQKCVVVKLGIFINSNTINGEVAWRPQVNQNPVGDILTVDALATGFFSINLDSVVQVGEKLGFQTEAGGTTGTIQFLATMGLRYVEE